MRLLRDSKGRGRKLLQKYDGPFEISVKVSPVAYRLRMPASYRSHPVINIAHLELYSADVERTNRPKKRLRRADFEDQYEEFEIEKIVAEDKFPERGKKVMKYRVRWKGYDHTYDEWKSERDLRNAPEVLAEWGGSA